MTRHALEGTLRLEVERTPLDSIEETWERLKRGSPASLPSPGEVDPVPSFQTSRERENCRVTLGLGSVYAVAAGD